MTTETKNQQGYYVLQDYYLPCQCMQVTDTRVTNLKTASFVHADTVKRPKPSNLISAMTARAHYRTLNSKGTFCSTVLIPGGICGASTCAPGASGSYLKNARQCLVPALPAWVVPPIDWSEAIRNKIRSRVVSYAEAVGERRESLKMLNSGASTLKRAWTVARAAWRNRKTRRAWVRMLKRNSRWVVRGDNHKFEFMDLVSADLAIKFGIIPTAGLLNDSVNQASLNRGNAFKCQVTISKEKQTATTGGYGGTCTQTVNTSVRAICYVRLKDSAGDYTAGSLPEALWAGTRMSFMIDWFFNVSSYLSALDAMRDVQSVYGCTVRKTRKFASDSRTLAGNYVCETPATTLIQEYQRQPISVVPLPRIGDNWEPTPSWGKLQSAIEVFSSLRRDKNR